MKHDTTPSGKRKSKPKKKFRWRDHPALLVFVLALVIRLIYLATLAVRPGFSIPIVDEVDYDRMAKLFATGQGLSPGPLFRPPLWPTVLGIVYVMFGPIFPYARLANVLLGALAVNASYRLGVRLFNKHTALVAGIVLSCYGLFVHFSGTGLATSLVVYLTVEALNLSFRARERGTWQSFLYAGLVWGLACIARPVALAPALIIAIELFFRWNVVPKERVTHFATFLIGFLVAIAPVTLYNAGKGDAVLISTNGGINFFFGNNPASDGIAAYHPAYGVFWTPQKAHTWAEQVTGTRMRPSEVSRFYYREGIRFLLFHPEESLSLIHI